MPEPAQIGAEEGAQIRHAVFQHGDAVDADAEGEALYLVRVVTDIAQHVGVHHAAAENLQPLIALADTDFIAMAGIADVHFHGRLGEREVAGAEAHFYLIHLEERLGEGFQRPFQVPHMRHLVDDETLDLMEHRCVGLIGIATVNAPRRDDAQRRPGLLHGADLHRAGMGSQNAARSVFLWREIERVVFLARGMLWRNIEGGKIVIIGFDVGPLDEGEAHIGENLGDLIHHLADGMDAPLPQRALAGGECNVVLFAVQKRGKFSLAQRLLALGQRLADTCLEAVHGLAGRLALFRRQSAEALHESGNAPLLAQRRNAYFLKRAGIAGRRNGLQQVFLQLLQIARCHGLGRGH